MKDMIKVIDDGVGSGDLAPFHDLRFRLDREKIQQLINDRDLETAGRIVEVLIAEATNKWVRQYFTKPPIRGDGET